MATSHKLKTATEKIHQDKKESLSIITLFLIATSVGHFLAIPFFLNYLNLFAGILKSIDSFSNAIIQVMSYTGEMFLPFFDMLNRNYAGNSQSFANTSGYVVIALFVLQIVVGIGFALRLRSAWYYQFAINALLIVTNLWLLVQPGFYPRNIGMVIWPIFILLILWEGSVLRFMKLKPSLKLLKFCGLYTVLAALVIFGGTFLFKDLLGR